MINIIGIIVTIVGLFFLIKGIAQSQDYTRKLEEESKFWPSVEGRIIQAMVKCEFYEPDPMFSTYTPKITYEYFVKGEVYYSRRICYGYNPIYHCNSCQECKEKHKDILTINNTVEVFFCFFNPSTSVLIPGYFYDSF